jgi:hypothetical protein
MPSNIILCLVWIQLMHVLVFTLCLHITRLTCITILFIYVQCDNTYEYLEETYFQFLLKMFSFISECRPRL